MPRPAAAYVRVSTSAQAGDDRFGADVQASAIEQYAQRLGLNVTHTYQDTISGTRATRDQLEQLLDEAPKYEVVVISSIDRLGRRARINYGVLDELLETGLEVHSTDMGLVDPEDEGSAIQFGIRSVFAENAINLSASIADLPNFSLCSSQDLHYILSIHDYLY